MLNRIISVKQKLQNILCKIIDTKSPFIMDPPTNWLPPSHTRGMTILDRTKFNKTFKVPMLDVSDISIQTILPHMKKLLFKMEHLKSLQTFNGRKVLLLHPSRVKTLYDLPEEVRNLGITGSSLQWNDFEVKYENWKADDIFRAVLPEKQESMSSFSRIGHIIHVNLKDHLIPYKTLIGEVLKDKVANCRTVVNKSHIIENTFRNFHLELLSGVPDYKVEVKENGTVYEFDFSTVYWNPRLATEHERIIKCLNTGDVLYDVFAGVGPFSLPAAKKKCIVLANDLNPSSFTWLQQNVKRNKVANFIQTFNKDGRDFILNDIKNDLINRWCTKYDEINKEPKIHIVMNLPALGAEFLDAFRGLIPSDFDQSLIQQRIYPMVHIYCFAKGAMVELPGIAQRVVEENLGIRFTNDTLKGIHFVRNVAPNKDMYRIDFYMNEEMLFKPKNSNHLTTTSMKRTTSDPNLSVKKLCN